MQRSSHKLSRKAFALVDAIQAGIQPSSKKHKKKPGKIVPMFPPLLEKKPLEFFVIYGGKILQPFGAMLASYRTAGSRADEPL